MGESGLLAAGADDARVILFREDGRLPALADTMRSGDDPAPSAR